MSDTSRASVHISRTASNVFAFLNNESKAPLWVDSCVALAAVSPGPKGVGTRLHYTYRHGAQIGAMDGTVIGYEPNRRLAVRYLDPRFAIDVEFDLADQWNGTAVTHRISMTPRTLVASFMAPMIHAGNRWQASSNLARLKALLERGR